MDYPTAGGIVAVIIVVIVAVAYSKRKRVDKNADRKPASGR